MYLHIKAEIVDLIECSRTETIRAQEEQGWREEWERIVDVYECRGTGVKPFFSENIYF